MILVRGNSNSLKEYTEEDVGEIAFTASVQ